MNPTGGSVSNAAQYIPNPRHMSPPFQTPHSHNPSVEAAGSRGDTGGHPVPVYTTQEVVRHSVPMPVASLRQHTSTQNTRPGDQNLANGGHPHFQYNRDHPTPLQISSSANTQPPLNLTALRPRDPLPSPLREFPMSPLDHTSATSLPQATRRQSDPPQPVNAQTAAQPAFDPIILSVTDTALAPVRSALDTVWTLAVNNVRVAMSKMNNDFTYLATQERHRNSHLTNKVASLESQLQAARQDVNLLRKERLELQTVIQAYKDDNQKLHSEKEQWEIERRVLTSMEDRRGESELPQLDMNKVLGAVTEQVSKQMEQQMSAIMVQIEEQKSLRSQAEQRFAQTLQHLSHVQNRGPSPTVLQFSSSLTLQSGSHSPTSTCVVSPILATAKSPPNASDIQQDDLCRPMSPRKTSPLVSTPHTADSPAPPHTTLSPTRRRTSSFDQQPRKKPRLMDEAEDRSHTPNFLSSPDPEGVSSAMQIGGPKAGDSSRRDNEEESVSASAMVKPEPSDDAYTEGSKEATPSSPYPPVWAPVRKPTPKPFNIPNTPPVNPRNSKLGIGHIDLLYRTDSGMMSCRMCLSRSRDLFSSKVMKFEQNKATWDELINHCRSEHPTICRDLEKLGPTQIAEMKQRLMSGEKSAVSRG